MTPQIKLERWFYAARATRVLSEPIVLKAGAAQSPQLWAETVD
jgi:hypothetical protein